MTDNVVSVSQLNFYIKSLLEGNSRLAYISVCGEISNYKVHFASGHIYFTLKDNGASLKCVMFKGNAQRLRFSPADGMKVVCTGRISVYERDGAYQLYAENIMLDGEGDLMAEFLRIKEALSKEGFFDIDRKKKLCPFPKKVAVITSKSGAAVQDIFNVLKRRYPLCDILLCPAVVQGAQAPQSLINALDKVSHTDADVVIIGRGGGSMEDLWCFNDERLARKIAQMEIPVISAVGHETDFTICDFVSDLRAPTPSAAAELAVPDVEELYAAILGFKSVISSQVGAQIDIREKSLKATLSSHFFASPKVAICEKRALLLDSVTDKINNQTERIILDKQTLFLTLAARFDALNPIKTMSRGFSVVQKNGNSVNSTDMVERGDKVTIRFTDGMAECTVDKIVKEQ